MTGQKFIVLSAKKYNFKQEGSNDEIKGTKLNYMGAVVNDSKSKGHQVLNLTAPYELFDSIKDLPAECIINFDLVPGARNVVKLVFNSLEYIKALKIDLV
jgi:hypothetical protein